MRILIIDRTYGGRLYEEAKDQVNAVTSNWMSTNAYPKLVMKAIRAQAAELKVVVYVERTAHLSFDFLHEIQVGFSRGIFVVTDQPSGAETLLPWERLRVFTDTESPPVGFSPLTSLGEAVLEVLNVRAALD